MPQAPISFEGFQFDPDTGELSGPTGIIRLGPQPARLLAVLLREPGALVPREELKRSLWPDTVVEADQGLNACVLQLRSALGDEAGKARFIETLPRRGYRFIGKVNGTSAAIAASPPSFAASPVSFAPSPASFGSSPPASAASLPTSVPSPPLSPPNRPKILSAVALILVAGAVWTFAALDHAQNRNVAIMPMVALTTDPAWVAEVSSQITERLVLQLTAQAPGAIGVVGPLTTQRFAGDSTPPSEIGKLLDVGYVMSGALRASDSTVFVQVVRIADGVHVCAFRRRAVGVNLDTLVMGIVVGTAEKIMAEAPGQATDSNCSRGKR